MRLLKRLSDNTFELTSFDHDDPPPYAILSHTWVEGQEVTYQELMAGAGRDKTGYDKIRFCGEQATADELQYFWVDTCCIDKSNSHELETAINYMFRWYQRASKCYVYLPDVSILEHDPAAFPIIWASAFRRSRWFKRGWTLQELIAPASVEFFSREGRLLGNKITLEGEIQEITNLPIGALRGHSLATFSVEERMSWVAERSTTVKEDRVYCLFGIFGVFLPVIPGEGEAYARKRLEEEIQKRSEKQGLENINNRTFIAAQSETKRPSCVVPFPRDRDFVDRGTLLEVLQEKCSAPASRVALVGLGGVGKSQLTIEYCYRTADRAPETWVFWVHAGNTARLQQSYQDIADQVEISGRTDPQADVFELVRNWLRNEKNGRWLLVLDNADDDAVLTSLPILRGLRHLSNYLPRSKHGTVIVTSRSAHAASRLVEDHDMIRLKPMDDKDAHALLRKKLGNEIDADRIDELATTLEYMPLALVQAAAYIRKRRPHYSVQQYLEEFRKSDKQKASLLNREAGHLRRNEEASNSIIMTWQMSFERIRSMRRSAADLLSLMSFFDRQGIPKGLLYSSQLARRYVHEQLRVSEEEEDNSEEGNDEEDSSEENNYEENTGEDNSDEDNSDEDNSDEDNSDEDNSDEDNSDEENSEEEDSASEDSMIDGFIDDILLLNDYSFISETTDAEMLEMHSLVQLATQKWLEGRGEAEGFKEQFVSSLHRAFPIEEYDDWDKCQALFPHVIAALQKRPRNKDSCLEWATLLHNAASYSHDRGRPDDAERLAIGATEARSRLLGDESAQTLDSIGILGMAKTLKGQWDEAEKLEVQAMETSKIKLGADHLSTLTSMNNLAATYRMQGRLEEAEELQVQVLKIRKTKLGADHLSTLTSMNNLASTYRDQGRLEEAEKLDVQVLEIRKIKLGADHLDTLTSMNNLASTYRDQGRLEEAEKLDVQVLEIRKIKLGADHLDTLTSMANLASTYWNQGRLEEAEKLDVQVLEIRKIKLGADHPDTLMSIANLAVTYLDQGKLEEAEEIEVQVMEICKTKLGADHPDTLASMNNLAHTWKSHGKHAKAIALLEQCVQQCRKVFRVDHPNLLASIASLEQWTAQREDAALCSKFASMKLSDE